MTTSRETTPLPLRERRERQGLSLEAVADAAEIDVAHLSRVERRLSSLSVPKMVRLADVLGLGVDWLARELAQPRRES